MTLPRLWLTGPRLIVHLALSTHFTQMTIDPDEFSPENKRKTTTRDCTFHSYSSTKMKAMKSVIHTLGEAVLETLWPTRCVLCDTPGELLCPTCRMALPWLDQLLCCPRCGAPHGKVQCTECCSTLLEPLGLSTPPFDGCTSALTWDDKSARLVTQYKDGGERRMAQVLAGLMADALSPSELEQCDALTYIPASPSAMRKRGWDHAQLLAQALSRQTELPLTCAFVRPESMDQRTLARNERFGNMETRVKVRPGFIPGKTILLIDDVYTTGATLFAASHALKAAGAERVFCATLIRV